MKVLHIADLHLGVKMQGISRLDEQKKVLNEIINIADSKNVDIVLVCGDVFQKSVPSAEAEDLFFDTIEKLSCNSKRFVLVVAGNHDDPTRIAAGAPLAKKHNILLVGEQETKFVPAEENSCGVRVVESGDGFVKLEKDGEFCTIAYLPYPNRSRMKKEFDDKPFDDIVKELSEVGASHFDDDSFNIFASHLFLVGGKYFSGNEEKQIVVGEALSVNKDALPKAHYIALGHLHKTQEIATNVWYSGAITCSRFYDSKPNVLIIDGDKNGVKNIEKVALNEAYVLKQVQISSFDEAIEKLANFEEKTWVELVFNQNEPLLASEIKKIKKDCPFVMNIKIVKPQNQNTFLKKFISKKEISSKELFENFYESKKGTKPSKELLELFLELLKEDEDETD